MSSIVRILSFTILAPLLLLSATVFYQPTTTVSAAESPKQLACSSSGGKWEGGTCKSETINGPAITVTIQRAINTLLFVTGMAAVIVIVISGFRFVTSNGDSGAVSKAKNSIIYATIGLIVAVSAYAIVNFILEQL